MSKRRAIALFSGGLDSILSVKYMQSLGYDVIPIFFKTPYLPDEKAKHYALVNGIDLVIHDISERHLNMLKNPRYGFGKNINPCIDCHAIMFTIAGELLQEYHADFLISGEVLGQRPMSQRKDAIAAVSKISGYKELLIRPLCQQLLPDTKPIQEGWVDREQMLAFHGRGRSAQKLLALQLGVREYPQPGGGCLLTDANYSVRLKDLLSHDEANPYNIELLKYGRHFRLNPETKLIVGRDEADNDAMERVYQGGMLLQTEEYMGPLGLLISSNYSPEVIELAASVYLYYSKKAPDMWSVNYGDKYPLDLSISTKKRDPSQYILSLDRENK